MLLISSVLLVSIGLYFLNKAIAEMTGIEKLAGELTSDSSTPIVSESPGHLQSILRRNQNLIRSWTRTQKTREQLKLLEAAASVQERKKM